MTSRMGQEDQIRVHTPPEINRNIDREIEMRVQYYSAQDEEAITERIDELDREADLERFLEANAATISILGVVMGVAFSRKWLLLPIVTGAFLFNHAIRGWCPPVNAFRRMGVRTRQEIDREKFALQTLRGDFDDLHNISER